MTDLATLKEYIVTGKLENAVALTKEKKRISINYAVPPQREMEVGETTVEKTNFKYITPKLLGAEIIPQ